MTMHRVIADGAADMHAFPVASVPCVVTSPPYPVIEMWDAAFAGGMLLDVFGGGTVNLGHNGWSGAELGGAGYREAVGPESRARRLARSARPEGVTRPAPKKTGQPTLRIVPSYLSQVRSRRAATALPRQLVETTNTCVPTNLSGSVTRRKPRGSSAAPGVAREGGMEPAAISCTAITACAADVKAKPSPRIVIGAQIGTAGPAR